MFNAAVADLISNTQVNIILKKWNEYKAKEKEDATDDVSRDGLKTIDLVRQ